MDRDGTALLALALPDRQLVVLEVLRAQRDRLRDAQSRPVLDQHEHLGIWIIVGRSHESTPRCVDSWLRIGVLPRAT